ncbi:unnamed protein product [Penicillium salamii]|nr:unnamed protein product [Penicillium salamii]CAG8323312.1 unnamed protein product [Penicillium salamii]
MGDQCILRLIRVCQALSTTELELTSPCQELHQVERSEQFAFTVRYDESNIRDILAIIVGPPGTPYELGFFEFSIKVPAGEIAVESPDTPSTDHSSLDYPANPPTVVIKTTNRGRTRFGPNLYANGKVYPSWGQWFLYMSGIQHLAHHRRTWHGERGEQWSPAQGLESVLLSIQSLLSTNPYTLEPGYDDPNRANDVENMETYKSKAMIAPLEQAFENSSRRDRVQAATETFLPLLAHSAADAVDSDDLYDELGERRDFSPSHANFDDYYKRRFLWYFEHYQIAIDKGITDEVRRPGDPFITMPFEFPGNTMMGEWNYVGLRTRLLDLRDKLMEETHRWPVEGMALLEADAGIAVKLKGQHAQILAELSAHTQIMDFSLVDENPFLWQLIYAGRTESRLEGGIIKIKIYISPRHPIEQPRVFVESPIYHIRVSRLGVLIYLPSHDEDIKHHIDGIINTLEEDNPPFNPLMTVHPEATALCWGSEAERRVYRRKVRASLEEM